MGDTLFPTSNVVFPRKVFNEAAFLHAGSFVKFSLMILMIYPFVFKKNLNRVFCFLHQRNVYLLYLSALLNW